jgi:hypothetical protein
VLDADKKLIEPIMEKWEKDLSKINPEESLDESVIGNKNN